MMTTVYVKAFGVKKIHEMFKTYQHPKIALSRYLEGSGHTYDRAKLVFDGVGYEYNAGKYMLLAY